MGIEALKQQLASGAITKEQFAAGVKALLDAGAINQEEHDNAINLGEDKQTKALTPEEIQKLVDDAVKAAEQSAGDRARTKAAQEKKALQDEIDRIKTEKMSAEEKAKFELDKLKAENEQKAAELTKREVALHTVDQLRAKELPQEFRDILAGATVEDTDARITAFAAQWQKSLSDAVEERFKSSGSNPNKGRESQQGGTAENPFAKESLNLTKQAELIRSNPTMAKQMASAAGITLNGI